MSSYRARGRGRASFTSFGSRPSIALPGDRPILGGLSSTAPLQTIEKLASQSLDEEVKITDLQYAGSYNWLDKPSPTIIVPGSPRQWINRAPPYRVHPDDGMSFKDQNGFRCSKSILLPLITAVNHMSSLKKEEFDWTEIDIVTDRNNLRKLLRWINGSGNDFRIDTQLAGKTLLFNRWENRYQEEMSGKTFGFNFELESTRSAPGCEKSTGHHRIVRYDLNGLKLVVRFEVDACISSEPASPKKDSKGPAVASSELDDIIGALSGVSLNTKTAASPPSTESETFPNVTIIPGGSIVPQSSIVELTTRSTSNAANFDWKESYPQLFLSQTTHHFLAVHERGFFKEVNKRKLDSPELKKVALDEIKDDLKKLKRALNLIKDIVVKHGERGRLSFVCQGSDLKVYERISQASCLPDEVLRRFDI